MSQRDPNNDGGGRDFSGGDPSGGDGDADRVPPWLLALAGVTVALVIAVVALVVVPTARDRYDDASSDGDGTTTTTSTVPTTVTPGEMLPPEGPVAYVAANGAVMVGEGAEAPVEIARDAAVADSGLGAVALAPTGDLVAYARNDGALVTVPVVGGDPTVLATDVALGAIGGGPSLVWDATGGGLAYLAVGTEAMVQPRPEEPPPLSDPTRVYRVPLPEGVLGNVVRVVERTGEAGPTIGDPSTRSMVGISASQTDDLMVLESVAPDTLEPYTLMLATFGSSDESPTILSADDPTISPDGAFVVAVGVDKTGQELVRIQADNLSRSVLVSEERICNPSVSPDATRIVYGAGEDCERLKVISSTGGAPVDVTPTARPGTADHSMGALGWTTDGRFVAFSDCRATSGPVRCDGQVTFLELDQRREILGPVATTVAPVRRPLIQDLQVDLLMAGPIEYQGSFPIDGELAGELTELSESSDLLSLELVDGERTLSLELQVQEGAEFAAGQMTIVDPEAGIDRTFLVLATPSVLGLRVVSLTGMWISTTELPVATGEFRLAVRRR